MQLVDNYISESFAWFRHSKTYQLVHYRNAGLVLRRYKTIDIPDYTIKWDETSKFIYTEQASH